jgi:deazaflavin-dependent oxidoreductase (nitroreductase family)
MTEKELMPWEMPVASEEEFQEGNRQVVEEFRANGGKVGGMYEGSNLLLLTTTGRRSGKRHTIPLAYHTDDERLIVSSLVEEAYPDWYHNLRANPAVAVELGTESFSATARVATGDEWERLWSWMIERNPWLADHQRTTRLQIPLVIIQR